jgi:hypothetical protein
MPPEMYPQTPKKQYPKGGEWATPTHRPKQVCPQKVQNSLQWAFWACSKAFDKILAENFRTGYNISMLLTNLGIKTAYAHRLPAPGSYYTNKRPLSLLNNPPKFPFFSQNSPFGSSVNSLGIPINSIGLPINALGCPINSLGSPISPLGIPINSIGFPINPLGSPINSSGFPINSIGPPINPIGRKSAGFSGQNSPIHIYIKEY